MATAVELATKVMQHLGRLQAGQTINSDDSTYIQDAYSSLYLMLQANHSVNWGPADDVPQQFEGPVTMILANQGSVCKAMGVPVDYVELTLGQKLLKQALSIDDAGEPAQVQNF